MKPHEPMLRYIRKNVERPKELPILMGPIIGARCLRWKNWGRPMPTESGHCPMGLLPCSTFPTPVSREHFVKTFPKEFMVSEIRAFANWWDRQRDPKLAVEAVWGKK